MSAWPRSATVEHAAGPIPCSRTAKGGRKPHRRKSPAWSTARQRYIRLPARRRDTRSALRLMRKLLKKQGFVPKILITDKLRSYASALRRLRLTCRHEQGLGQNNRAENSHQP